MMPNDLVESDDVIGTNVYDANGEHVGSVERLIIGKRHGRVAHAVLSFGGVWGFGADYYPVPWSALTYDEDLGGLRVNITREQVENAPKYDANSDYDWSPENDRRIGDYYGR